MPIQRYIKEGFWAGESQDDMLGGKDMYLYGRNIDVDFESRFIQLAPKVENVLESSETIKDVLAIKDRVSNSSAVLGFTDNYVYSSRNGSTPVDNSGKKWYYGNFIVGDNVYMLTNNGYSNAYTIYTVTMSDAFSSSWSPSLVTTTTTLPVNDYFETTSHGVCVVGDIVYIHMGWYISRYEPTFGDSVTNYDIFGEEIAGVTYLGGYLRVYTVSGRLMLWDGVSEKISESIDFSLPIKQVYQVGKIDYIYTGTDTGGNISLNYSSGYDLVNLFKQKYSYQLDAVKFFFMTDYSSVMTNYNNVLYGAEGSGTGTGDFGNAKVYSFGKKMNGMPNAYSKIADTSSYGNGYTYIGGLCVNNGYLYYGFVDGTYKGMDKILVNGQYTQRQTEGSIYTNSNNLGDGLLKKTLKYLYLKVKNITDTKVIKVYMSVDDGDYNLVQTIDSQPLDNIARIPLQGDCRDVSFRFDLEMPSVSTSSPRIYYGYMLDYEIHNV